MDTVVDFDDIFAEADHVLPPSFPKDHYARANGPASTAVMHLTGSTTPFKSSYIFTLFIATVLSVGIYWGYSWVQDVRRRQRDAFFQLEHRRRHGIPDEDKRPWAVAYPDAQARRQPQLRRPAAQPNTMTSSSSYDPNGNTLFNHIVAERNAKIERENFMQQEAARLRSLAAKGGLFPGPMELARQQSSAPSESSPYGRRSQSPFKNASSPQKSTAQTPWPADPTPAQTYAQTNGTMKGKGRKRLYMDPREDSDGALQAVHESAEEDPSTAFSLPKRQRVNTWGTDSKATGGRGEKRAADDGEDGSANVKRPRGSAMARPHAGSSTTNGRPLASGGGVNGSIPIGRLKTSKVKGPVTFTPSTRGSSSSNPPADAPVSAPARGQKRDREDTESVVDGSDAPRPPARKRGRENRSPKKSPSSSNGSEASPGVLIDALCAGHKVGDIWEAGHRRFKVGPDGRRLIAGMVRERRPKYHMPADSIHQDHTTMVDVVVEKWFTEEDYATAKAAGDFSWQDESPSSTANSTPSSRPKQARASSSFWDAPDSALASPTDGTGEVNPFARDSPDGRHGPVRARASVGSPAPIAKGPRNSTSTRWQKQAKEAEALKRIQEAKRAQQEAAAAASSLSKPATTPTSFAPAVSSPLAAPSSTATFPAFYAAPSQPEPTPSFAPSAPPTPFTTTTNPSLPKPMTGPSPFSIPSIAGGAPGGPSSDLKPTPAASAPAPSPFNFGAKAPQSAPSVPKPPTMTMPSFGGGSSTPNPFGSASSGFGAKPAALSVPAPAASTASPFAFGSAVKTADSTPLQPTATPTFSGPAAASPFSSNPNPFGAATAASSEPPKPTGFNFGPDAKRTESASSSGTTAVAGGSQSFGDPKPADQSIGAAAAPTPFAGASAFGSGAPNFSSGFGAKPAAQGGFSMKGAATNGFATANGNGNGASNGFGTANGSAGGFNKKWTNPDLVKKDGLSVGTNGGGTSNGDSKPNPFQTGPVEPPSSAGAEAPKSMFGGSGLFGATSAFGAQPSGTPAADATSTPATWTPPAPNPFAAPPLFAAHRPTGAPPPAVARSRSRSSRPLTTRPPR